MTLPKFNTVTLDVMWQVSLDGWHTAGRDLAIDDAVTLLTLSMTETRLA
jgi:hypothetical protein